MSAKVLKKRVVDRSVYDLALERIRTAWDMSDAVSVSFSGGKDSTATLQLCLKVARERGKKLKVFFWDEEAIPTPTIDYVRRISKLPEVEMYWLCLPIEHRNACSRESPNWYPWAEEDKDKWVRPMPTDACVINEATLGYKFSRKTVPELNGWVTSLMGIKGTHSVFMGIRAAESMRRYRVVAHKESLNYMSVATDCKRVWLVKPIYDWTTEDVWTAPKLFGWDYNDSYDHMTKMGIGRHEQRVCPPWGEEPLTGLYVYAQAWPDLYEKMIFRVPGAATAARYSRTQLYGFGGSNEGWDKTEDQPTLIAQVLLRWPDEQRAQIRAKIDSWLALHKRTTKDPVPLEPEHPKSGISWGFLYMLAVRGDLKNRRGRKLTSRDTPEIRALSKRNKELSKTKAVTHEDY